MRTTIFLALALLLACGESSTDTEGPSRSSDPDVVARDGDPRGTDAGTSERDLGTSVDAGEDAADDISQVDVPQQDAEPAPDLPPREDTGPRVEDECAQVTAIGDPIFSPVDVIWAIDTSGSMDEETELVETQLNSFVDFIESSGLDVQVVVIGADTVCIPSPLSTGVCPDEDTVRYRHIRETVGSSNAFETIADTFPLYRDFLRPEAVKHFIVVSDDESGREAAWFRDEMAELGMPYFVFHAIVSLTGTSGIFGTGCSGVHGDAEAIGDRYIVMSEITDGTASSICEPDWSPIFDAIATNVIAGATLPCAYGIPDLGAGLEIIFSEVDVRINGVFLTHHDDEVGCASAPGWFYDDNETPTTVHLCNSFCGAGFEGDELVIEFGCVKS
ncbi:MAG: hypothetical protein ACJAYU_002646 [Bradymonadia bacterium]|jgi:hypothetical protein